MTLTSTQMDYRKYSLVPDVMAGDRREPSRADGGDGFGLSDELSPSGACGVDDGVVVFEDGV
jgi:hypothetical protein